MGHTAEIVCGKCNYRRVFNIGRPEAKETLENVLKNFDKEVYNTVKQLALGYGISEFEYGDYIFCCSDCRQLLVKPLLVIKFKNDLEFTPKYFCNKCSSKLKLIIDMIDIEEIPCPECAYKSLKYKHICNWN